MNYPRPLILGFILAAGFSVSPVLAQQNNSTARNEANEALRQKAFAALESIAAQISTLQSAENRARLGSNIAASLWDHDEGQARTLLLAVEQDIRAGLENQTGGEPPDTQRRMVFLQLRVDTVERIAKHDPELALAFFKATEAAPDANRRPDERNYDYSERMVELRLARQVAGQNPEVALSLARQSLTNGFSDDLLPLLRQLNRKHKEQASTLYGEIVAKLKRVDWMNDDNAFWFARNLASSVPPNATDDASFRELIGMFVEIAKANGCNNKMANDEERSYFCQQIAPLAPAIERVDPAQAAALKRWQSQKDRGYQSSLYVELNDELDDVARDGTVDDLLALRTKYPQLEANIYWRAVQKADAAGDTERARKLATDFAGDPRVRQSLFELIDRNQRSVSEFRKQLKEIEKTFEFMPRIEQRVYFLLRAATMIAPEDRKEALKALDQANALVETMKPGKTQLEAQIGLAVAYCAEKSDRGLAIMESLVPKLNELVGGAVKLDGYENHYLRDGEWNMANQGVLGSLLSDLAGNAPYFAWCDFDRAVSISGQFERPEIRLMAQLKLAQGILAGHPRPFVFTGQSHFEFYEIISAR